MILLMSRISDNLRFEVIFSSDSRESTSSHIQAQKCRFARCFSTPTEVDRIRSVGPLRSLTSEERFASTLCCCLGNLKRVLCVSQGPGLVHRRSIRGSDINITTIEFDLIIGHRSICLFLDVQRMVQRAGGAKTARQRRVTRARNSARSQFLPLLPLNFKKQGVR